MAGAVAVAAMLTGCSDNVAEGLYADDASKIILEASASGLANGELKIGSAQSSTVVSVTSNTRWTVDVTDCDGSWCQIVYGDNTSESEGDHIGNGVFLIDASPNRNKEPRECNVTLYGVDIDGNHIPGKAIQIHLSQDRQSIDVNYSGDVISAYGTNPSTEPLVTVTANQGWKASASQPWVKIVPGSEMDGNSYSPAAGSAVEKAVSFRIKVDANPGTSVRYAEVSIESPSNTFAPIRLNITQQGSSDTFLVTPANVPAVSNAGGTVEFQVLSPREKWTAVAVSAGDWVTLDRTSGDASNDAVTVTARISANDLSSGRQAAIIFTREGGMGETIVTIDQERDPSAPGPQEPEYLPAISTAWVMNGWTQTEATLKAYYSSPSIELAACGAFICPVRNGVEGEVREFTGRFGENNTIVVSLVDLEPNTTYKAWCFVKFKHDGADQGAAGSSCFFTTPDNDGQSGSVSK